MLFCHGWIRLVQIESIYKGHINCGTICETCTLKGYNTLWEKEKMLESN